MKAASPVEGALVVARQLGRLQKFKLDPSRIYVLLIVAGQLAGSPADLLRLGTLSRSTLFRALADLVKSGLLKSERDRTDRRKVRLAMTQRGTRKAVDIVESLGC